MLTMDSHGKVVYKPDPKDHSAFWMGVSIVAPVVIGLVLIFLSQM